MKIYGKLEIIKRKVGGIAIVDAGHDRTEAYREYFDGYYSLEAIYGYMWRLPEEQREAEFKKLADKVAQKKKEASTAAVPVDEPAQRKPDVREGLNQMMRFFTEFSFSPSFRFLNTLVREKPENRKTYIANYFKLAGSPYAEEIGDKMENPEFDEILFNLSEVVPTKEVNTRFRLYYGAQGTGKTTQALAETDNVCVVCNSSMLPADLMEDFTFDDGKATFHPSALARAMEAGTAITLDEINLLPFDSLRFLQGIFDGKKEFQYKGNTIHIRDGFKVIGTMNLVVNGVSFGLPEPLVDRCEEIREFALTAEMLEGAF